MAKLKPEWILFLQQVKSKNLKKGKVNKSKRQSVPCFKENCNYSMHDRKSVEKHIRKAHPHDWIGQESVRNNNNSNDIHSIDLFDDLPMESIVQDSSSTLLDINRLTKVTVPGVSKNKKKPASFLAQNLVCVKESTLAKVKLYLNMIRVKLFCYSYRG